MPLNKERNQNILQGSPNGVVAHLLNHDIIVSELEFQLLYDIYFWTNTQRKGMNPLILPAMN